MHRVRLTCLAASSLLIVTLITSTTASATTPSPVPLSSVSVSFTSPSAGWALTSSDCHNALPALPCLRLWHTTDAGSAWSKVHIPSLVSTPTYLTSPTYYPYTGLHVVFANARDGWIYGWYSVKTATSSVPGLWSTHNGGVSWTSITLAHMWVQYSILALGASDGTAHMIVQRVLRGGVVVYSSPISADKWHVTSTAAMGLPAGGSELAGSIVLRGASGWAVVGNDRGQTGAQRLTPSGRWVPWRGPCASVGNSDVAPIAISTRRLFAICTIGGFGSHSSGPVPSGAKNGQAWLFESLDAGATFYPVGQLRARHYEGPYILRSGVAYMPNTQTLVASGVESRGTNNVGVLIRSSDSGSTWRVVARTGSNLALSDLDVVSRSTAYAIVSSSASSELLATRDAGVSWRTLHP